MPLKARPKETSKNHIKRPVLGPKSTNLKVTNKKNKLLTKPQISPPILISSSSDPFAGQAGTGQNTTVSAAYIDKKISALQQQADAQGAETREKEKTLAAIEASSRPSPLQRGKSVLTTAKRAIASRLGSPKIKLGRTMNPLSRTLSGPEYGSIDKHSNISSNTNRPLPVYESMRTRRETPELQEENDPFADTVETNEAWSDFEFDFDRRKDKRSSLRDTFSSHASSVGVINNLETDKQAVQSESPLGFSNKISGLRQHPDTEFFSSSPVGFSTPRVRLEPICDANGKKRLSAVPVHDPSVMDFSFEEGMSDDEADPLIQNGNDAEHCSSVKRKSATEDLRTHTSKRAKPNSANSGETTVLAKGFGQLGTSDVQAMPGVEVALREISPKDDTSKTTGFGIFNRGKGKDVETSTDDPAEVSSIRRHSRQHSSSQSRPTSVLFSRESRARVLLLQSHKDDDEMDVDELQMEGP